MAHENHFLSDEEEVENEKNQELTLVECAKILSNYQSIPCPPVTGDQIVGAFAINAAVLKGLLHRSSLRALAGDEESAALVEMMPGYIAISTASGQTAARAFLKTETILSDECQNGVHFSIDIGKLLKISKYCNDLDLLFALQRDDTGNLLKISAISRSKFSSKIKYNLTVGAETPFELLVGVRTLHRDQVRTRNLAAALRLCSAACSPTRRGECQIEVGDGLATGESRESVIFVRDPALHYIGTQVLPSDARLLALAIRHMGLARIYETPVSFVISDGSVEVAIKKATRPRLRLERGISKLIEEDVFQGPSSGLWNAWFVNTIAKQYSKIASRKGEPSPPAQLALVGVEMGKIKVRLERRRIKAESQAENFSSVLPLQDRTWGAFDLSSLMQVWEKVHHYCDPNKQLQISTCGKALKLTSPDDMLEAYFPFCETDDPRFRTR